MPLPYAQAALSASAAPLDTATHFPPPAANPPRALPNALLWRLHGMIRTLRPHVFGFGKRRHEMALADGVGKQRRLLDAYSSHMLDVAIVVTGLASIATYVAYALDPATQRFFGSSLLWLTGVHPLFGVLRVWSLIASRPGGDGPMEDMLRAVPFVLNLDAWTLR